MDFRNSYADGDYAAAYARLEFPGTYYLAFRDLPQILSKLAGGRRALDFGCGAGRSTRFLRSLGYSATGVDIAEPMIQQARLIDPSGDYQLVADGGLGAFSDASFDLVLSAFTFDNVATQDRKIALFRELGRVITGAGRIVSIVSSPEIYLHEWASFSTRPFPENRLARCGDEVRIIVTALADRRPVVDILWPDEDYRSVYRQAGLRIIDCFKPRGRSDEPFTWINETAIAPWTIYVLGKSEP